MLSKAVGHLSSRPGAQAARIRLALSILSNVSSNPTYKEAALQTLYEIQSKTVLNTMWLTQSVLAQLQEITRDPRLSMLSNTLVKIKPVAAYGEIDTDVAERAQTNPGMVVFLNDGDAVLTNLQYVINPKGILRAFRHPEQQLLTKTNARAIRASFLTERYAEDAALLAAIKAVTQLDYRLISTGPNQQEVWHGITPQRVMSCVRTELQQPSTSTQAMLARGDVKEVLEWLCGVLCRDMERPGLLQAATFNYNTGTAQPAFNSKGKVVWLADHIHSTDTNTWISGGPHSRLIEPVLTLIDKDKRQQVQDIGSTSNIGSSSSDSSSSSSLGPAKAFQHNLLQQGCGTKLGAYYFSCLDYLHQPEQCTLLQKSTGNTLVFLAKALSKTPTPAGWADTAALPVLIRLLLDRGLALRGHVSPSQQQQQQQQQQPGHHGEQPQQQQQPEDDLRAAISAATAAELQPQGLLWTEDVIDTEEGADEGL